MSTLLAAEAGDTVTFLAPGRVSYEVTGAGVAPSAATAAGPAWVAAKRRGNSLPEMLGDRVVLGVVDPASLPGLIAGRPLTLVREVGSGVYLYRAADAPSAIREAAALAGQPGVTIAHPVRRHRAGLHSGYAKRPADRYYDRQWHLEQQNSPLANVAARVDVNARAAWAVTRGEGILIANVDDGVEATHPDLAANWVPEWQKNFHTLAADGSHSTKFQYHGTATAGLHSAAGNAIGGLGVSPAAHFTSWVIFDSVDNIPDEEGMANAFLYASNSIPIQNHSWGNADFEPLLPGTIEVLAVSNAATLGRSGRGVVMVRSGGNTRKDDFGTSSGVGDANLDGYANDPHALAVGAVSASGRVAGYSAFGACLLVAGPGGDTTTDKIFTTDPVGTNGSNRRGTAEDPDLADYTAGTFGFYGTSAAAPIITGVTALILAANPSLSYRDVQQILVLSARQTDPADPDMVVNQAGFPVSHNTGFGVPDAAVAVSLAKFWPSRPTLTRLSFRANNLTPIPDDGLRVEVTGPKVPVAIASIPATGSDGLHPDQPTATLPLVDVGEAAAPIQFSLVGKAALIRRGPPVTFAEKLKNAANAAASFAVVINNESVPERFIMRDLDFTPIPGVMIGKANGDALAAYLAANPTATVRLSLNATTRTFAVKDHLLCEHVGVRIRWGHDRMGDLRVTLRSPGGTTSVLHRPGSVTTPVPDEMTYWTTHSFFESAIGNWTVAVADEASGVAGAISEVELILQGVRITDIDADGLDDGWELANFGDLLQKPADDPDGDGYSNLREYLMGTHPLVNGTIFATEYLDLRDGRLRVTWPSKVGTTYTVETADTPAGPWKDLFIVPGTLPESGVLVPMLKPSQVVRVRR